MSSEKLRLSTSGSSLGRSLVFLAGLVFVTVGTAFLLGGWPDWRGLFGLPFLLLGLLVALLAVRSAVWLDDTEARVRSALVTRTVNLATADITPSFDADATDPHPFVGGTPRATSFVACQPQSRRCVVIALQTPTSSLLPPHELRALAAAMTAGRSADGRHRGVYALAEQLRTMADLGGV